MFYYTLLYLKKISLSDMLLKTISSVEQIKVFTFMCQYVVVRLSKHCSFCFLFALCITCTP